jgi:branched-chain amino acid transport system ATP-binding protein
MSLILGEGITKYFGGLTAVYHVDFHIDEGEIVGLIGPNGAGKTTLFNVITGALPLDRGRITFKGKEITNLKAFHICRAGIARTFQSVKVFGSMSVYENVVLGIWYGMEKKGISVDARKTALELLEFVGLGEFRDMPAGDLTLANQRRLEVARALATRPDLLLLDELMAGLNPKEVSEAIELVRKIRERGITIFMIEHVMKAIMSICNRIMVLHHGEKIAEGTPEEVARNEKVIEVYLGEA